MSLASEGKLIAPTGQFRVIGVDSFEGPTEDYWIGDFHTAEEAFLQALKHGGEMNPVYVYDAQGHVVFQAGTP